MVDAGTPSALLGSALVVAVIGFGFDVAKDTLPFETAKAFLQLGLVSAAGAALSALAFNYQRRAAEAANRRDQHRQKVERKRELKRQKVEKDLELERGRIQSDQALSNSRAKPT